MTTAGKRNTLSRRSEYCLKEVDRLQPVKAMFSNGQVDMTGDPTESLVISVLKFGKGDKHHRMIDT